MIALIIIIAFIIIITLLSNYMFILTQEQMKELIVGTFLLMLFTYGRNKFLDLEIDIFLPAILFMVWYFITKLTANIINKDNDVIRNYYQNTEIVISTIIFMFLFMFIRPMLLNESINSDNVVLTTLLFFIWYYILENI